MYTRLFFFAFFFTFP
ncbi:hypothetical protein [Rahnella sp. CFA14(1/10)]